MTTPDSRQYNVPSPASPLLIEGQAPGQSNAYEHLVAGLDQEGQAAFEALVAIIERRRARLLDGYLMQRARTPDASSIELQAQERVLEQDPGDPMALADTARLRIAARVDNVRLWARFLPADLRPAELAEVVTEQARERLAQDPVYANLAMQARAQRDQPEPVTKSEWGQPRDFTRELGFYAVGRVAAWARGRRIPSRRKKQRTAGL